MDLSSSSSAVNVSFAPKPTHLSFLKRWLILVLGCSLFLPAFSAALQLNALHALKPLKELTLICAKIYFEVMFFSLNHRSWLVFWCKKHLLLKIMSLPCIIKLKEEKHIIFFDNWCVQFYNRSLDPRVAQSDDTIQNMVRILTLTENYAQHFVGIVSDSS